MEEFVESYPRPRSPRRRKVRNFRVYYDLGYEPGVADLVNGKWHTDYRTLVGARIAILFNLAFADSKRTATIYKIIKKEIK